MATDPVCGMYVDEKSSTLNSERKGRKYYFCSASCKLQFEKPERELKNLKISLAVSWPVTIVVALLTYLIHFGYGNYILFILASIVQFYSGQRFYAGMIDAVKNRSSNMDMLIGIGTSAAWGYSTIVTFFPSFFPSASLYFDTSTIIISLILTGTYLQRIAESRATNAVSALMGMQPKIAHVIEGENVVDKDIVDVLVGDLILVRPGEKIPVDGKIVDGESALDESLITGESMPMQRKKDDPVIGSSINLTGAIKIKATRIGEDTTISQIIRIVEDAASSKVPIQKLADKIASVFVPIVVLVGIFSALGWYLIGGVAANISISIFVSVLIIACPCALGIATPAALLVASGKAAKEGILIKSGDGLQAASRIDTVVIDKTGTLTEGKPNVTDIIGIYKSEEEVLSLAATAEINSEHPLGKAIVERARAGKIKIDMPKNFSYKQGSGVVADTSEGRKIVIGNRDLFKGSEIQDLGSELKKLELEGKTSLILGVDGRIVGIIALEDRVKKESKESIDALYKAGIDVWLVTGDNRTVADSVGKNLGIKNVIAGAKPEDKMKKVEELQKEGRVVAMIGDGVNDAPALTKADLGIAIGAGTEVAMQAGSIVLIKNNIYDAVVALRLGKKTMLKIRENLLWAFGYNIVLIPIAAGILIPFFTVSIYNFLPVLAALAMAFSSVTVVSNSLLLRRFKV